METSQGRPYGIGEPGTINSEVKAGTFVETMIAVQELLKHSEEIYEAIYRVQKQIKPGIINKNSGLEVSGGLVNNIVNNNASLIMQEEIKRDPVSIFQLMTDIINKTHRELDAIERSIQFVYDSIGIYHMDDKPNATK